MQNIVELKIYNQHGKHVVYVASHRGEELFMQFACQGIESRVVRVNGHTQLELEEDVNLEVAQAILAQWSR